MSDYLTEQEQIEIIKNWIKQYSGVILAGIIIALAGVTSYRYWNAHQVKKFSHASTIYDEMLTFRAENNLENTTVQANKLVQRYARTPYGGMGTLMIARNSVLKKNYQDAEQRLADVMQYDHDESLRQIARIRLARIKITENKPEESIKLLQTLEDKHFKSLVEEVKGDAYLSMKKIDLARNAYKTALSELPNADVMRPLLQMKYDNLA